MKENKDLVVRKSQIEGLGVFANQDIKKGEVVLYWQPKKLSKTELQNLNEEDRKYLYEESGVSYLMGEPERYINFSCDPNTNAINRTDVAVRDIKSGEEITSDYGEDENLDFICQCTNCKK